MSTPARSLFLPVIAITAMAAALFSPPTMAQPYQPDQGYPGSSSPPTMAAVPPSQMAAVPRRPEPTAVPQAFRTGTWRGTNRWDTEVTMTIKDVLPDGMVLIKIDIDTAPDPMRMLRRHYEGRGSVSKPGPGGLPMVKTGRGCVYYNIRANGTNLLYDYDLNCGSGVKGISDGLLEDIVLSPIAP